MKWKCSHLSENCLLNHDEPCEAKVVQKFGETREKNFKYGISYISSRTVSLKSSEDSRNQEVTQII